MLSETEVVLLALLVVFCVISIGFGYVLWRVSFENPGIITKSISGGVSAPRKRADSDDGPDAVNDMSKPSAAADGKAGNAVIAAGATTDANLPEGKRAVTKRRGSNAGELGADGERIPDWEIDYRKLRFKYVIGKGNFGEVWLATWLGSPVAVKTIVPELQNKEKLVKRFQDEIILMSTLHHPNVVLFLGACTRKPNMALVIEYCAHGSLHHFLKNEHQHGVRITMSHVLRFALDIARGVYYLHRRCSVVQRDLKARNILIDESLNAKVADFGLSRVLDEQEQNKLTACGTPAWTAPEIVKMEAYTDKVDVYSFGIIMWELITREEPYGGQKGVQIAYAAAEQGLRPEVPNFCPTDYADLMRQCWADNPSDRPTFAVILKKLFQMKKACDEDASKILGDPLAPGATAAMTPAQAFYTQPLPKYVPSNAGGAMIETRHGPKGVMAPGKGPADLTKQNTEANKRRSDPSVKPDTTAQNGDGGRGRRANSADDGQNALKKQAGADNPTSVPGTVESPKRHGDTQDGQPGTGRSQPQTGRGEGTPQVASSRTSAAAAVQEQVDKGLVKLGSTRHMAEWDGDVGDSDEDIAPAGAPTKRKPHPKVPALGMKPMIQPEGAGGSFIVAVNAPEGL